MKIKFLIVSCVMVMAACKLSNGVQTESQVLIPALKKDTAYTVTPEKSQYTIDTSYIIHDIIYITLSYSGGCEEHQFDLLWDGGLRKGAPPIAVIYLVHHNNGDACREYIQKTISFNISTLKQFQDKPYNLNISLVNYEPLIFYKNKN